MGQESFYCGACKTLLRTRDLEKGHAVRLDDQIFCRKCSPLPAATPKPNKGSDSAHQRISSTRTPRGGVAQGAPAKSPLPAVLAAVGGIVAVLLLAALAAGGPAPKPVPKREEPPPAVVVTPVVEEPRREPRPLDPRIVEPRPTSKPVSRDVSARKLLEEARAFAAASPDDLDGALERARRALLEADGTPVEPDVRGFEESLRAKIKEKRAAADARLKDALAAEKFGEALALLEKDKAADAAVRLALEKAWGDVQDKLFAARKKGAAAEVKALAARAEAWGVAPIREELARILASPVDVDPPAEVLAWRKKLSELPLPLDYAAAYKELEKTPGADKADLEAFRLAGEIQRETLFVAPRLKAGQDVRLERFDEAWGRAGVAGRLLRATALEFELVTGEGRVSMPAVEITPAGWCELLKAAPRAAQLYRALEGDPAAGGEPLPPNIMALGERMARQLRTPEETAARRLFAEAERDFVVPTARLGAAPKYLALSKDLATIFARRAKGVVDERAQASQEVYLTADDLSLGGQFVPTEVLKGVPTATMAGDGKGADSYLQVEATLGETTRAWVYASACCLETLAMGLQAPDLMGPNPKDPKEQISFPPGGPFAMPLKASSAVLRVKHGHPGREIKWLWIPLPLPKYASAGPRKLRLVGERDGMSIAYVWLSVGRPGPPRESELKEFEKSRLPAEAVSVPAPTGTLLREVWHNLPANKVSTLTAAPGYPDRPSSSGLISLFEGPADCGDDYGTRVRGYLYPPATGDYVFYVATDDDSELWLSLDDTPNRKRKISGVEGSTGPRQWDHPEAGKSAPIALKGGRRYYVELLHKEGSGKDHFAVGWQLPGGGMERPIPGTRLSPWTGAVRPGRPTFYRAFNFNGPALTIDGQSWEGRDAGNVAHNGGTHERQDVAVEPSADGPKAQMLRAFIWNHDGLVVTVSAVPAGKYLVYAYFWEDNGNEVFDILLNTRVVKQKYNSGAAGHWERLGPWPVEVADGKIELRTSAPADANFSGLEIWRSNR